MRNIALVGKFCSGKSTIGERLVHDYGYTQVGFAANLKRVASAVYSEGRTIRKDAVFEVTRLSGDRETVSGRQVLQELGQAVKLLDRDFWVKWLLSDLDSGALGPGPFVLDDCRFPFEAWALSEKDWRLVKVETPDIIRVTRYEALYGRLPTREEMEHPSETQVDLIGCDIWVPGVAVNIDSVVQDIIGAAA